MTISNTTTSYTRSCGENTIIMKKENNAISWNLNGKDLGEFDFNSMIFPLENCAKDTKKYIYTLEDQKLFCELHIKN